MVGKIIKSQRIKGGQNKFKLGWEFVGGIVGRNPLCLKSRSGVAVEIKPSATYI